MLCVIEPISAFHEWVFISPLLSTRILACTLNLFSLRIDIVSLLGSSTTEQQRRGMKIFIFTFCRTFYVFLACSDFILSSLLLFYGVLLKLEHKRNEDMHWLNDTHQYEELEARREKLVT